MPIAPRPRMRGFTLVEIVIALALTSVLLLAAIVSLRGFGQAGTRLDALSTAGDDMRLISGFVHATIEQASPREYRVADVAHTWLRGGSDGLSWLGVLPARNGVGGLSHLRIEVDSRHDESVLLLRIAPFVDDALAPDWSHFEPRILLAGVERTVFSYRGVDDDRWSSQWAGDGPLPHHVRIDLAVAERQWPPLFVTLAHAEPRLEFMR